MSYVGTNLIQPVTSFKEPASFSDRDKLKAMMLEVIAQGVSDTVIQTYEPICVTLHGVLRPLSTRRMPQSEVLQLLKWAMDRDSAPGELAKGRPVRGAYVIVDPEKKDRRGEPLRHRFRVNATRIEKYGAEATQIVMRTIPNDIPTVEQVQFPPELLPYMTPKDGIVYVTGPTGVGKSSTFASIIRYILEHDTPIKGLITTLEDPIEFSFDFIDSAHSIVAQSQVGRSNEEGERGRDLATFEEGVRDAMRRFPALLLVGETRDWETASAVITGSNTGHPVFTTAHTNDVATLYERLLSSCPKERRDSALWSLVDTGRVIINQALAKTVDGKRTPLREWLVVTPEVRDEILSLATSPDKITPVMRAMVNKHGHTMRQAANEAYERGLINESEMRRYAGM